MTTRILREALNGARLRSWESCLPLKGHDDLVSDVLDRVGDAGTRAWKVEGRGESHQEIRASISRAHGDDRGLTVPMNDCP